MKKIFLSFIIIICMVLALMPEMGISASAADVNTNAYEHATTYTPVTSLYTSQGHPLRFHKHLNAFRLFDATTSQWTTLGSSITNNEEKSKLWLYNNSYLLNKFMEYDPYRTSSSFKLQYGYHDTPSFDNGKIQPKNHKIKKYKVCFTGYGLSWQDYSSYGLNYSYSKAISQMNYKNTGNIGNMLEKGDIRYLFAHRIKTVETGWFGKGNSHDYGRSSIFDEYNDMSGNRWHNIHYNDNGPDIGGTMGWRPAYMLTTLQFEGESNKDKTNDAYLSGGFLVGKDIAGPRIKNITVTSDEAGENPIPNGAITLNNIDSLADRTVYFQVEWDEPVRFSGLSSEQIVALNLKVQTLGIDGTSGMIAEVPFLNFTPKKTDSTQLMTFEYKIPDPYTDISAVTQERGYFYKFSKVVVSQNENESLWNNLRDLSGNKFAANSIGQQPSGKVEKTVSSSPFVDLEPFAIENIRVTKDAPENELVEQGELLNVTLELNKNFANSTLVTDETDNYFKNGYHYENLPSIALNVKDSNGSYVTITPENPADSSSHLLKIVFDGTNWANSSPAEYWKSPVKNQDGGSWPLSAVSINSYKVSTTPIYTKTRHGWFRWQEIQTGLNYFYNVNSITYNVQLYPGYTVDGDSIKVSSVSSPAGAKDSSGYTLMNYTETGGNLVPSDLPSTANDKLSQYTKSPDRHYKLDFEPPVIDVAVSDEENGIIKIAADVSDASLWGADAAFDITVDGKVNGKLQYQPSSSGTYGEAWINGSDNSVRVSFGAPVVGSGDDRNAYAFVKLPANSEVKGITVVATVTDEARNSASVVGTLSSTHGGWSGFDALAPTVSLSKNDEKAEISITDMNAVTYSYEWADSSSSAPSKFSGNGEGNSGEIEAPVLPTDKNTVYNKTLWVRTSDSEGNESDPVNLDFKFDRTYAVITYTADTLAQYTNTYPGAKVTIDNVKGYWYVWVEKPANFIGMNKKDYGDIVNYAEEHSVSDFQSWAGDNSWTAIVADTEEGTTQSNNSTTLNISLTADTPVIAVDDAMSSNTPVGDHALYKWRSYGDEGYSITAADATRPLVLLIGAVKDDDTKLIKAIEFDTFYGAPEAKVRQYRFSTNDKNGKRQDNVRNQNMMNSYKAGLYWADDTFGNLYFDRPINIPNLYDFAESEFYLAGDPVTGLDRVNLGKTKVELVKITHKNTGTSNSAYPWTDGGTETLVKSWNLNELDLTPISDGSYEEYWDGHSEGGHGRIAGGLVGEPCSPIYSFTLNFDPQIITPALYEFTGYDANGSAQYQNIRYEFRLATAYTNGETSAPETLTHWIFNNDNTNGLFYGVQDEEGHYIRCGEDGSDPAPAPALAFFTEAGNDISSNVPVITFSGTDYSADHAKVQFAASEYPYSYPMLWWSPTNGEGDDKAYMGSHLSVRWSTDPTMLEGLDEDTLYDIQSANPDLPIGLASFSPNGLSDTVSPGVFTENGTEIVLYYQFFDRVKLTESPVYLMKLRRDDNPPVVALSVSETDTAVQEVQVKVDSVYDVHGVTEGDATRYVIDTPAEEINFFAEGWRRVDPGESFNTSDNTREDYFNPDEDFQIDYEECEDGCKYVKVRMDENGVFNFTRNGYLIIDASDSAMNFTQKLVVNGVEVTPDLIEELKYEISNIDCEPPAFISDPVWMQTDSEGKFNLEAEVDSTATNAYIRFDKEYTEFLTGSDYDEHTESREGDNPATEAVEDGYTVTIPASDVPMFAVGSIPGQLVGTFENGLISLTDYIKYDETAKAASVTLIVSDSAGNQAERDYIFSPAMGGVKPSITNSSDDLEGANVNNLPVYNYGATLDFTVPVTLSAYNTGSTLSHGNLPIYTDGALTVGYTDAFGMSYSENIYANIFGPAFAHNLTFWAGDTEIGPTEPTNQDITVKVDTSGTANLTVDGQTNWQTPLSGNGSVTYTLSNSELSQTQTFTLPVSNIDKAPPTAIVSADISSATDEETGEVSIYAVSYQIDGFNEADVTVISDNNVNAPTAITFDKGSQEKTYTFRFRDAAGNVGTYTADASEIVFSDPEDSVIAGYRLVYNASGTNGSSLMGSYTSKEATINLGVVNSEVFVKVEALNAGGELVPSQMSFNGTAPEDVTVFTSQKNILFTKENAEDQTVTVKLQESGTGSEITVPVTLPSGTIDKTVPTGTVKYIPQEDGSVKVYLVPLCSDLTETDGVEVQGQKSDGSLLTLQSDADGYYVNFDINGSGYFTLWDKAGNIGTVTIAVLDIDKDPPAIGAEGWSGLFEANTAALIQKLLQTPTNNSIKIFFSFNEQLSHADVTAFANKTSSTELIPTDTYVTAVAAGNTVTVEFKQNCQAKIAVYDVKGNFFTLWRPKDAPVTVIDKDAPELMEGYPKKALEENVMKITYVFKNGEKVMLLSDSDGGYKNSHTAAFTENGQYILTFVDRAGNILSVFPTVSGIDELEPHVKMSMQFVGEGTEAKGKTESDELYYYTNKNIRIVLAVEDETADDITVTAARQDGAKIAVTTEAVTVEGKNYTHHFTASENGLYVVTVRDKWGHENIIYPSISLIDRTAPAINLTSTKAVSVQRNADAEAVKSAILQGVTATDTQSGTGADGVTISVDMSEVDLTNIGSYTAKINACDRLGNSSVKTRKVNVTSGTLRVFSINGEQTETNDVFVMYPGSVTVETSHPSFSGEAVTLYWAKGYKTAAQMKYADAFDGAAGFTASEKGYYTILAQSAERGMYLVYVYVY